MGHLLAEGPVRLVTFTGPGGVGKTWAAHELRRRLAARTGMRTATAEVHGASTFDDLLSAVAHVVDVRPSWAPLEQRLSALVAQERQLLVLDGCERLVGTPHPVARLLDLGPALLVVATSLGPLKIPGEHVVGLDPLVVPSTAAAMDDLRDSPAVGLFLARAAAADQGFQPEEADLPAIAELCRRVHGLPLGIEIMAARVAADSPAALVEHLDSGHEITASHSRGLEDPRHLSIESALSWSYALLDPAAARLLRRMSVFAAPASVEMLAAVMTALPDEGQAAAASYSDVLDTVSELVDHRLVEPHQGPGEPGFALIDLVRDFAFERLVDEGEQASTEDACARAVIEFALCRSEALESADDDVALTELARSEADLRAVLRGLVGRADVDNGLRLATALAPFVVRRGHDGFVRPALTSLLRRAQESPIDDARLARATLWKAWLAAQFAEPDAASELKADLAKAVRLARRSRDDWTLLLALSFTMQALPLTGDDVGASAAAAEGLPLAEATGDRRWVARFCARAGIVAARAGRVDDALELARRGLDSAAVGDSRAEILLALLLSGLPPDRTAGLMSRLPPIEDLIHTARRLDDPRYLPFLLRMAAWLALRERDLRTAAARCAEALRLAQRRAVWHDLPFTILPLAVVAVVRRDLADAARFHGMVRSQMDLLRRATQTAMFDDYADAIEVARRVLGDAAFDALAERGESGMRVDALSAPLAYAESVAAARHLPRQRGPAESRHRDPDELTPREREVLGELTTGATNKEISLSLGMAPKTVMHHSMAIYRKLGVRGRAEATAWAFRHGLAD